MGCCTTSAVYNSSYQNEYCWDTSQPPNSSRTSGGRSHAASFPARLSPSRARPAPGGATVGSATAGVIVDRELPVDLLSQVLGLADLTDELELGLDPVGVLLLPDEYLFQQNPTAMVGLVDA